MNPLVLAAALAGASLAADEAEAGGLFGEAIKTVVKGLKRSSAAEKLVGRKFRDATIKEVYKGKGDKRYLLLSDGSVVPTSREGIYELSRHFGTEDRMKEFASSQVPGQYEMARASLDRHWAMASKVKPPLKSFQEGYQYYKNVLGEAGIEAESAVPHSVVEYRGRRFSLPTAYANVLEAEGTLKILKDLK